LIEPIKMHPGCEVCQCYPECRIDCPDHLKCLDALPVYWSKEYRAKKYAEEVRKRKPQMQVIRKDTIRQTSEKL
jgi:hypothetical protein